MDSDGDANERITEANEKERLIEVVPDPSKSYTVDDAISKIGMGCFQLNVFLFSSLIWGAHVQIVLQFALLSPSWQCEFQLSNTELATITTMYPLGNLVGSIPIGILCDKYGRKKVINITNLFLIYFALMSAFVPSYIWIVILRFVLGVLEISSNQAATYCVEFMPVRFRASAVVFLNIFWTMGTGVLVLLCYFIIPILGWRYLILVSCISSAILPIYYWFVPTSPRFLVQHGRYEEAKSVLKVGAKLNCRSLPEGELVHNNETIEPCIQSDPADLTSTLNSSTRPCQETPAKGGIRDALSRKYLYTTLCLALIWFTSAFLYYSAVLITNDIFTYDHHCQSASTSSNSTRGTTDYFSYCNPITPSGYLEFFITTLAELPGILITVLLLDIIGRKLTFAFEFILCGVMFFLLYLCTPYSFIVKTAFLFTIRACTIGAFSICFLYTGEIYPTNIRASVLSILSSLARLATIFASFSVQVLFRADFMIAIGIFGAFGIITGIVSLLLPHETRGKKIE